MKKVAAGVVLVLFMGLASVVAAQTWSGWRNCGGWCGANAYGPAGSGGGQGRMYDPAKAEVVKGEVTAIEKFTAGRRMGPGIGLKLKTASGELFVHLGPLWYIEQQGEVPIKTGDSVEVKGVPAERGGTTFFIAAEVRKGDKVLKLRDDNGIPLWAGWRGSAKN